MYWLTHTFEGIMVFIFRDFFFPTYWPESAGRGTIKGKKKSRKINNIMPEKVCVNLFIAWLR